MTVIKQKDGSNYYQISDAYFDRVEEVINYCLTEEMYVVINMHHDGAMNETGYLGWLHLTEEPFEPMKEKFVGMWGAIAERFKNYDEVLKAIKEMPCYSDSEVRQIIMSLEEEL